MYLLAAQCSLVSDHIGKESNKIGCICLPVSALFFKLTFDLNFLRVYRSCHSWPGIEN